MTQRDAEVNLRLRNAPELQVNFRVVEAAAGRYVPSSEFVFCFLSAASIVTHRAHFLTFCARPDWVSARWASVSLALFFAKL